MINVFELLKLMKESGISTKQFAKMTGHCDQAIKDLALLIKSCTNSKNLNIKISDTEKKSNKYVPSVYKAKNGLSLTMGVDLETAILKTVDFYS